MTMEHLRMTEKQLNKSQLRDFILDEALTPVARMRLFSDGVNQNTRIFQHETVIGDRACLACGNCVDACPVVKDKQRFVFIQNQRTSMALENIVGLECRRCFNCIQSCPQVSKINKDHAASFRRGEKIVHLLFACFILLLAGTGIFTLHYEDILPGFEKTLLQYTHRTLGILLILLPLIYFIVDKHHLFRLFRKIFVWDHTDRQWITDMIRHIKDSKKYPMPYAGEFNTGQKAWYLYITGMIPIMSLTGLIMMLGFYNETDAVYITIKWIHLIVALMTDMLLFVHIYLKYLRKWAILIGDVVKVFLKRRHLNYAELYGKKM